MIQLLKKIPWWGWAAAAVTILFLINNVSGSVYTRKLWNMMADQIRVDQSKIVKTLETDVAEREQEIADLEQQIEKNQSQQIQVRAENDRLKGRILELQSQRKTIIISNDPDRIVDDLRKLGFSTVRRGCK